MKLSLAISSLVLVVVLGFQLKPATESHQNPASTKNTSAEALYRASVEDAMSPENTEICSTLVEITPLNPNLIWKDIDGEKYVLMVSWKGDKSYYEPSLNNGFYNTGKYPIWVSTAPELLNKMKSSKYSDANMRLLQLLGLPPNAVYNYFIEFWVNPEDMFRPCPDKEINDGNCKLCFDAEATEEHKNWINENRVSRYYQCDLYNKYPWSQLGYTYDWSPTSKDHVGLSEFVIGTDANIVVEAIYTTADYLAKE